MSRNLEARLEKLEAARIPAVQPKGHQIIADGAAEAEQREAEMRAAGEIGPDDVVVRIIIVDPERIRAEREAAGARV